METAAESDETISCKNSVSSISNSSNNRNSATPDKAWTTFCGQGELLRAYRVWSPLVQSLIHHAPPDSDGGVLRWDLRSLPPLERWTSRCRSKSQTPGHGRRGGTGAGSVALLGDAAHPMYPMGSNGGGQAILDARALADALAGDPADLSADADPVRALRAYEDARLPVTAQIVHSNRRGGPEQVIDEVDRRAPDGFDRLADVITGEEIDAVLAGYAATTGAARPRTAGP